MNNKAPVYTPEQQKAVDTVKDHYKMLMTGQKLCLGAALNSKVIHESHAIGIQGSGRFLPYEEVNTCWYRVNNSVRKSKWKCLGKFDEDGLDEDSNALYDGGNSEEHKNAMNAKKNRKAYRRGKEAHEALTKPTPRSNSLLNQTVGKWADAE